MSRLLPGVEVRVSVPVRDTLPVLPQIQDAPL
jgi:hypothetical protein